jgi:hypothetical protein
MAVFFPDTATQAAVFVAADIFQAIELHDKHDQSVDGWNFGAFIPA